MAPQTPAQRRDRRVWWGIIALAMLAYAPQISGVSAGAWPFLNDGAALFGPWRAFAHDALAHGTLPLWNPSSFCGLPFMSNAQTATLYPLNLVYWVCPLGVAFLLDAFMHQLMLAFGMYSLARALGLSRTAAWLVMGTFTLGGAVSGHLFGGHMSWHAARAYLPWELWAMLLYLRTGRKRYAFSLVGLFALQIFAGYPPLVILSAALCCGLSLARGLSSSLAHWRSATSSREKKWLRSALPAGGLATFAKVGCLIACLSAVCILPMQEQSRLSVHGSGLTYSDATMLSGTWRSLLRLLIPDFFGGNSTVQWSIRFGAWEEAAYLGILVWVLAVGAPLFAWRTGQGLAGHTQGAPRMGWDEGAGDVGGTSQDALPGSSPHNFSCFPTALPPAVPWLWGLALASWVLAMGANIPGYHWLFTHVGVLRLTRFPVRWLEVWYLCGALVAGFAFDNLLHRYRAPVPAASLAWRMRLLSWILLALWGLCWLLAGWMYAIPPSDTLWLKKAQFAFIANDKAVVIPIAHHLREVAVTQAGLAGVIALAFAVACMAWLRVKPQRQRQVAKLFVALALLDVLFVFWDYMVPLSQEHLREYVWWPPALTSYYRPTQRWDCQVYPYSPNQNLPLGLDIYNGYDALSGRRYFEFADYMEERKFWRDAYTPRFRPALLRVAGVTHTLSWNETPLIRRGDPVLRLVTQTGLWKLWRHDGAWPRVYLSRQLRRAPPTGQLRLLNALAARPFGQQGQPVVVSLKQFQGVPRTALLPRDQVRHWQHDLNTMTIDTVTTQPSVLVQAEALYPGWRAWVNGQPTALESGNYLFRAVQVPAGAAHTVVVYDPQTYRFSLFVSLCGVAFCSALGAMQFRLRSMSLGAKSNSA